MANTIIAGNATNNGLAFSSDSTGVLNILTGTGSGTTALSIDASQNVSAAANLTVTGSITATNGVSGAIRSGTVVPTTSGTSAEFTSIPSGVKRITVMFSTVSTNGTGVLQLQLGTGATPTYTTSGYLGGSGGIIAAAGSSVANTTGFRLGGNYGVNLSWEGTVTLTLLNSATNLWVANGTLFSDAGTVQIYMNAGTVTLSGVATAVRVIASATGNPSDTFDLGSINILYE